MDIMSYMMGEANGSGGGTSASLVEFAIRPDAELIKTWLYDKKIVSDEGATMPVTASSNVKMKASTSLETVSVDFSQYDYYLYAYMVAIPVYSGSVSGFVSQDWAAQCVCREIVSVSADEIYTLEGEHPSSAYRSAIGATSALNICHNGDGSVKAASGSGYGCNFTWKQPTIGDNSIEVLSPDLVIRSSNAYYDESCLAVTSDVRYQYIYKLYRAAKGNMNFDAWAVTQGFKHISTNVHTNNGTLT